MEIGSGSGIISIMLALLIPDAKITAIDLSKDALAVAKINAQKYHVENRITFVHGSYLAGLEEPFDMLVSNPPYIADDEPLAQGLSFEPSMALYGGCIGDEMLKIILKLYHEKPIKMIACEMGYDQREPLMQFAHELGHKIEFYKDYAELDRGFWIKEKK